MLYALEIAKNNQNPIAFCINQGEALDGKRQQKIMETINYLKYLRQDGLSGAISGFLQLPYKLQTFFKMRRNRCKFRNKYSSYAAALYN